MSALSTFNFLSFIHSPLFSISLLHTPYPTMTDQPPISTMTVKPPKPYDIPLEVFEQILQHLDKTERRRLLPLAVKAFATLPSLFDAIIPTMFHTVMLIQPTEIETFFHGIESIIHQRLANMPNTHESKEDDGRNVLKGKLRRLFARLKISTHRRRRERGAKENADWSYFSAESPVIAELQQQLSVMRLLPILDANDLQYTRTQRCYSCVKHLVIAEAPNLEISARSYQTALSAYASSIDGLIDNFNLFPQVQALGFLPGMLSTFNRYLRRNNSHHPFSKFLGMICQPSTLTISCPLSRSPHHDATKEHKLSERYLDDILKPMLDSWRLDALTVQCYEGGILPAPRGQLSMSFAIYR